MADPFFMSDPAARKRKRTKASDDEENEEEGGALDLSEEEGSEQEEEQTEEDRFAHETPDETRLRLAERYVRKLEALNSAKRGDEDDDEEEDEQELNTRVHKRLKQDVLEASGRHRRRLAHEVAARDVAAAEAGIRAIRGHQLPLTCVALADDEKTAYTGSKDGTIIQYDVETGKRLWRGGRAPRREVNEKKASKGKGRGKKGKQQMKSDKSKGHVGHVLAIAVSSDGRMLATGGDDRLVHLWDTRTNTQIDTFSGHRQAVTGLTFRQGGQELYSASADATVKVWSTAQMSYVETLFGHQAPVTSIDCLGQERPLTAGGFDRSIRLFKVAEETHLVWKGHTAPIDGAAYLTDQLYATVSQDGSLSLWDLGLKKPRSTVPNAHAGRWVTAVAACRQSDLFATGSSDGVVRFWSAPPAGVGKVEQVGTATAAGFVNGLAIAPSGRFALAALGTEPRMGRWDRQPDARNVLAVLPLVPSPQSAQQQKP